MFNAINRTARPATAEEELNHLENEVAELADTILEVDEETITQYYEAKKAMKKKQAQLAALERAQTRALAFEVARIKTKRALSSIKLPRLRVEWK